MTSIKAIVVVSVVAFVGACVFMAGRTSGDWMRDDPHAKAAPRALPIGVTKFHDASDEVTCWQVTASISCLPDQVLGPARREGGGP